MVGKPLVQAAKSAGAFLKRGYGIGRRGLEVAGYAAEKNIKAVGKITKDIYHGAKARQPLEEVVAAFTLTKAGLFLADAFTSGPSIGATIGVLGSYVATKYVYEGIKFREPIKRLVKEAWKHPKETKAALRVFKGFTSEELGAYVIHGKKNVVKKMLAKEALTQDDVIDIVTRSYSIAEREGATRPLGNLAVNYIEGMPHGGQAEKLRKALTDFGSPWRGILGLRNRLFHGTTADTALNVIKGGGLKVGRRRVGDAQKVGWLSTSRIPGLDYLAGTPKQTAVTFAIDPEYLAQKGIKHSPVTERGTRKFGRDPRSGRGFMSSTYEYEQRVHGDIPLKAIKEMHIVEPHIYGVDVMSQVERLSPVERALGEARIKNLTQAAEKQGITVRMQKSRRHFRRYHTSKEFREHAQQYSSSMVYAAQPHNPGPLHAASVNGIRGARRGNTGANG